MNKNASTWGTSQGRDSDDCRPPMRRGDLSLAFGLWVFSWVVVVGIVSVLVTAFL